EGLPASLMLMPETLASPCPSATTRQTRYPALARLPHSLRKMRTSARECTDVMWQTVIAALFSPLMAGSGMDSLCVGGIVHCKPAYPPCLCFRRRSYSCTRRLPYL